MSYYEDHYQDLIKTGETCRFVKSDKQRRSFCNSIRRKENVIITSNPLGRGYMISVRVKKETDTFKGSKYAEIYERFDRDGFVEESFRYENEAISFRNCMMSKFNVTTSLKLDSKTEEWKVKCVRK